MGKKLIIKGADFSANCIPHEIVWIDITERLTLQKGINGITAIDASNENAVYPRLDVSEFSFLMFVVKKRGVGPLFSSMESGNVAAESLHTYLSDMFDARESSSTVYIIPGTYKVNMEDVPEGLIYLGAKISTAWTGGGDYDNVSDYMEVYAY